MPRSIPAQAIQLVKDSESLAKVDPGTGKVFPYMDDLGWWTIGWGHLITVEGVKLRGESMRALAMAQYPGGLTVSQCEDLVRVDMAFAGSTVERAVKVFVNDSQFGALVDFAFNAGAGNFTTSTLVKRLNAGDYAEAANQFLVWNKGRVPPNGELVELGGLTKRCKLRRKMFLEQA